MSSSPQASGVLHRIASEVRFLFGRLFSEAASFARLKMWIMGAFLGFVAVGFLVQAERVEAGYGFRLEVAPPGALEIVAALISLIFLIGANLYSRIKRREYELKLIEIVKDSNLSPELRTAILEKFRS